MDFSDLGAETDGEEYFTNLENKKICYQSWKPAQNEHEPIRKAVFILHGFGEHYRAYDTVIRGLLKRGFLVCAHDHVGHGKSEGDRAYVTTFDRFVEDFIRHVDIIRQKYPDVVCYIIGHSMGGAVALKTALDHPTLFYGVALIAPAIIPDPATISPFKKILARMAAMLLPQMEVAWIDPQWLCRDQAVVDKYVADPLNWHGGFKAKLSVCLLSTMEEIVSRISEITWPILLLHGTEDKLCMIDGSQQLYHKAPSQNKQIKILQDAYHQIHKEINGQGEQVINDVADWLAQL